MSICITLQSSTLELLLNRQGFSVQRKSTFLHLGSRNLLIQATLDETVSPSMPSKNPESITEWKRFAKKLSFFSENIRRELANLPRPIYFIGASHPQCNFINYASIGKFVDFMIDDDPEKAGKYPPIFGSIAQVITTNEFFTCLKGGTLVLTGFGYLSWTKKIAQQALFKSMKVFEPKLLVES